MNKGTQELSCRELVELISDYLEDRLALEDRARFEAHLENCVGCRAYLDQMRSTIRVLGKLDEASISPENRERLLAVLRDWKKA